jgi:hypothetical protein
MTDLSHALSLLAAAEHLALDPELLPLCREVRLSPMPKNMRTLATWRPRQSIFFTLIKSAAGTLLYCHENHTLYRAAPCVWLSAECPVNTAFLCQWCVDKLNGGAAPRLLVFDMVCPDCPDVAERGRRLREWSRYLPLPICVLQWVGEAAALESFVSTLPHPVECIVALGPDPWHLYRHMRVALPEPADFPPVRCLGAALVR